MNSMLERHALMELRTLRYLLAVVDSGSVTAASHQVHIAQPSLSRQLRQLETELGVTLFNRERGRLSLNPAGQRFVPIARDLIARADAATIAASSFAAGRLDRITIAAPPTTMTDVIAPFLATLRPDDPFPSVIESDPPAVYDALRHGADLAISTEQPPAQLAARMIAVFPIWLYVRPDHPWADQGSVELEQLADEQLLLLPIGFKPRQLIDEAAARSHVELMSVAEVGSSELAQALAAAGRGVAVVSDDSRFGLLGLRIVAGGRDLTLQLHAGWDARHHAGPAIATLVERITEFCIARYGASAAPASSA
jgi:DNA-binding transcriptional LysR family regulator